MRRQIEWIQINKIYLLSNLKNLRNKHYKHNSMNYLQFGLKTLQNKNKKSVLIYLHRLRIIICQE